MPASVADFRERARRRLPRLIFDYLEGGADAIARTLALIDMPAAGQLTSARATPTLRHDRHVQRRAVAA